MKTGDPLHRVRNVWMAPTYFYSIIN